MKFALCLVLGLFGCAMAATSCAELKAQGATTDGDYEICIGEKKVRVLCHDMNTASPKEYVRLHQPNHADIYAPRQQIGGHCNGPTQAPYNQNGHTTFTAIRLDLNTMEVVRDDFLFSSTSGDNQIQFGYAGDCYSWSNCPKGTFLVDLTGTDFHMAPNVSWIHGGYLGGWTGLSMSSNRKVASSTCGGWCGYCRPVDDRIALAVDDDAPKCCDEPVACPGTWKCLEEGATEEFNFATCVNEQCGCKEGFQGCGTVQDPCRCDYQVVYVANEAFCVPPSECKGESWHCAAVTEQFDFVECESERCKCKDGFSPEFPSVDDKCRCAGVLVWEDSIPTCQPEASK